MQQTVTLWILISVLLFMGIGMIKERHNQKVSKGKPDDEVFKPDNDIRHFSSSKN